MALAREGGARVVAGFVEDVETLTVLYRCGVDYVQGYFVQPPLGAEVYDFGTDGG